MVEAYSRVVATKEQVSSELAGEAVILDRQSRVYYGLNSVGVNLWNLVYQPKNINVIRDTFLTEYFVEPTQCDRIVLLLLQALKSDG